MSIYNTTYKNKINIRCNDTTFETIKVWDPALERYVPVTGGGGGEPTTLPYYAKTNRVEFGTDTTKTTLNENGLVFTNGEQQESVNFESVHNQKLLIAAHGASLEELDGRLNTVENTILPAHEASLEELDGRVLGNTNSLATLTTRVTNTETVNTTQGTNIAVLQTKTANITQTASTSNCFGYASTSTPRALINSAGLHVYNATSTTTPSYPHAKIEPTSITLATSPTGSVFLDVTRIDNLAKLTSVTTSDFNNKLNLTKGVTFPGAVESTDLSGKKMIVMDSTTKALSYATIPSGGATLPSYLKENNILMTSATHSLSLSPSVIEFGRIVGGNNEVLQLDMDSFANLVPDPAIKNIPKQSKWVAPNYTTMGGTAPTVVSNGEVHNFNKPLYFFNEMHKPGDTLWVDLSTWNASVGTTDATSRGIFLSFKAFEWSENQTYEITFSQTNVTVTTQEVYVFNTTTDGRRALFVCFKSNSGTVPVTGWLKIKLGNAFKTPVFPDVSTAYPSSAVQP